MSEFSGYIIWKNSDSRECKDFYAKVEMSYIVEWPINNQVEFSLNTVEYNFKEFVPDNGFYSNSIVRKTNALQFWYDLL